MNSTTDNSSADYQGTTNISGGFGYATGVPIAIVSLLTIITITSYFCTRGQQPAPQSSRSDSIDHLTHNPLVIAIGTGVDEATLLSYPKIVYSEAKLVNKDTTAASGCSICLGDYKDTDMLRMLPDCGHLFHLKCVDPWLRVNPTCPICRTSPLPTPLTTPLSEVVPLASQS